MNTDLQQLQPYPFEKLAALKAGIVPPPIPHIALSIGEPKHPAPDFIRAALTQNLQHLATYPSTKGIPELRGAIASWAMRRFHLDRLDAEREILPVSGTREALFAFAQAAIERAPRGDPKPVVVCPNPFYQIYEGAAYLAGAEPYFINCDVENNFMPDLDAVPADIWQRCQLIFLCSPGNPTGAVLDAAALQKIIALADRYDFIIASDECYSEIYGDEQQPPLGLLEVCQQIGRSDYRRCVVFHSLSKRSNVPGLRSGFVAGDADIMRQFLLYRTYHGCALPVQHQWASIAAWSDEQHVRDNRVLYRKKFDAVLDILGDSLVVSRPQAAFYLWAGTPIDDIEFAQRLFAQHNVTVLPGQYLARPTLHGNPGANRIRMALVADFDECVAAAQRIKQFVASL